MQSRAIRAGVPDRLQIRVQGDARPKLGSRRRRLACIMFPILGGRRDQTTAVAAQIRRPGNAHDLRAVAPLSDDVMGRMAIWRIAELSLLRPTHALVAHRSASSVSRFSIERTVLFKHDAVNVPGHGCGYRVASDILDNQLGIALDRIAPTPAGGRGGFVIILIREIDRAVRLGREDLKLAGDRGGVIGNMAALDGRAGARSL